MFVFGRMVDSQIVNTGEGDLASGVAGGEFHQSRTMATVLGGLFLAGATIGALSLLLPHPSEFDSTALWTNVAISYVAGVVLLLLRARLPHWSLPVLLLAGVAVVTRAVYYGHDPSGYYTIWYLWIGVYAFFFLGLRWGSSRWQPSAPLTAGRSLRSRGRRRSPAGW